MENLYLIGGNGFVGKNLVRCFYNKFHICVFDKYVDRVFLSSYPSVDIFELDLVVDFIPNNVPAPNYIINLASIVTAEKNLELFDELISSNLKILLNLYERFKDDMSLKLFIQIGSSEEYGLAIPPFLELDREVPNSPYAIIKQLTTNTSMMLWHNYRFPIMVVRPSNLFGYLQSEMKFIPYIISQLKDNKVLNVSLCEQRRDFIFVDDFANIIERLLENHNACIGEIVNVGSGVSISLKDIIEYCKQELHSVSEIYYGVLPYRENEITDLKCNIDKMISLCGDVTIHCAYDNILKILKTL